MIVVDAYSTEYIPFYLATQEFFSLMRAHLNPGGGIALNVERVPGTTTWCRRSRDGRDEFPQVWVWPALHFNELVVGLTIRYRPRHSLAATQPLPASVAGARSARGAAGVRRRRHLQDPLTDDRAPVEWLTDRAILAYIAAGGVLDEQLLPTAP